MKAAIFIFSAMLIAGAATFAVGIYLLAGIGWSLLFVGMFLFGAAALLRNGIVANVG